MRDLAAQSAGDVGVVVAERLPNRRAGVFHSFLVGVLFEHQGADEMLRLNDVHCADIRCWLQQRHTDICRNGSDLVVAYEIERPASVGGFLYAVDVHEQRAEVALRRRAERLFHAVLHADLVERTVIALDLFGVVEPLDRVEQRQCERVELRHVRHVRG